jgi:hypothetical protein
VLSQSQEFHKSRLAILEIQVSVEAMLQHEHFLLSRRVITMCTRFYFHFQRCHVLILAELSQFKLCNLQLIRVVINRNLFNVLFMPSIILETLDSLFCLLVVQG